MALSKTQATLVACRSMDLFVVERLLKKDNSGNVTPTPSAPEVKIDLVLKDLDADDKTYGLHAVRFILTSLSEYCKDLGHSLSITKSDLLDSNKIEIIDDLAALVKVRAKPIP